jgi:hypothetical protein
MTPSFHTSSSSLFTTHHAISRCIVWLLTASVNKLCINKEVLYSVVISLFRTFLYNIYYFHRLHDRGVITILNIVLARPFFKRLCCQKLKEWVQWQFSLCIELNSSLCSTGRLEYASVATCQDLPRQQTSDFRLLRPSHPPAINTKYHRGLCLPW